LKLKDFCQIFSKKWPEAGAVARLGLPVVINHASLSAMQFTDVWIAGRLGGTELAAISPPAVLITLMSIFGIELLTGVTTHVSQSEGKGRSRACGMIAWQGIFCAAGMGLICLIYYPTAEIVMSTLFKNQSPELLELETQYFQISLIGLAPLLVSTAIGNFFTGLGKTSMVMVATLIGVVTNLVLSLCLSFGVGSFWGMGFAGIACGTVLATVLQGLIMLGLFVGPAALREKYGTSKANLNKRQAARLIRTGLPIGVHGSMDFLAWGVVLIWLISFFGEIHLAASSIMMRCISISFLPADGMASAILTLVGKAVGSRDYLLARRYTRAGFTLIAIWMTLMALIFAFFGGWIIQLFTDDPEIIAVSRTAILWVAAFQFFDAMNVTYINALSGAGDTAWASAVSFTLSLVVLLGGGLAVVTWLPWAGASGVWAVATFYIFCQGLSYYQRWRTRAWQNPAFLI